MQKFEPKIVKSHAEITNDCYKLLILIVGSYSTGQKKGLN